jgi:hypothetical protein
MGPSREVGSRLVAPADPTAKALLDAAATAPLLGDPDAAQVAVSGEMAERIAVVAAV